jgi:hypothetical protein
MHKLQSLIMQGALKIHDENSCLDYSDSLLLYWVNIFGHFLRKIVFISKSRINNLNNDCGLFRL